MEGEKRMCETDVSVETRVIVSQTLHLLGVLLVPLYNDRGQGLSWRNLFCSTCLHRTLHPFPPTGHLWFQDIGNTLRVRAQVN